MPNGKSTGKDREPVEGYLRITSGRDVGHRYRLRSAATSIGRDPNNAITLRDREASRLHAKIQRKDDVFRLIDLNSSNGIFVNGFRVTEHQLMQGDRISLGKTEFVFENFFDSTDSNALVELSDIEPVLPQRKIPHEQRLEVFCTIAQAISKTQNPGQVLTKILNVVFEWTRADRGCVLFKSTSDGELKVVSAVDRNGEIRGRLRISRNILRLAKKTREAVLLDGAAASTKSGVTQISQAICVPIQLHRRLRGFIYLDALVSPDTETPCEPVTFHDEHVKLMTAIGQQVAVAVENQQHYAELIENSRLAAVGEAMNSLSHHIKNILQGISGGTHLVEVGLNDACMKTIDNGWSVVKRNQQRFAQLMLDMLAFGKVPDLLPEITDLNELIDEAISRVTEDNQAARDLRIEWKHNAEIDFPIIDARMISKAIGDLIDASVHLASSAASPKVTVSLEQFVDDDEIRIVIDSNGEATSGAHADRMFSIFDCAKGEMPFGISMPVARKLVREHKGEIVVSDSPDSGTRFCIVLPHIQNTEPATGLNSLPMANPIDQIGTQRPHSQKN